eukprot:CAMPEP_0175970854 /NCGR_PEP_ID=MMETSP0108-20121206/41309_1 /TAXON_ID=195067 ORGANISM="Goniomonas pacifica, Strain CCMP1869" /NCGR_SAMPLE_ID=MMETSP0108 /ASSEMBLY_ACC=CAM_ASM_000204 /LENGTH=65 /DNA_ID=CAMNT_0017299915 /DNA_START=480 /DNA_END=677 /DNA_ORIENTATION=-
MSGFGDVGAAPERQETAERQLRRIVPVAIPDELRCEAIAMSVGDHRGFHQTLMPSNNVHEPTSTR